MDAVDWTLLGCGLLLIGLVAWIISRGGL